MTEAISPSWISHGPLQVSPDGHSLEHEDGTRFFWLGDTAWRLTTLSLADIHRYFAARSAQGFNVIHFNATSWAIPNFGGKLPFDGEGPTWDKFQPNDAYWQHVDTIFDAAERFGLFLQLTPWWGLHANDNDGKQFFADPDRDNLEFGRFLGDRYGDRPNVLWCIAGEYQRPYTETRPMPIPSEHLKRLELVAIGIREREETQRLMTIHPNGLYSSSEDFHAADWLDFNTIQSHKGFDYIDHLLDDDWRLEPPKPVLSSEGWYEGEASMYDLPAWDEIDPGWLQRFQAYWSVFHGSFGYPYGHEQIWKMRDESGVQGALSESALSSPAASSLVHLRNLIERYSQTDWSPDQRLLTGSSRGSDFGRFYGTSPNLNCAINANDGSWAMVYSTRGMNIHLRTERLAVGRAAFAWFNPRTGRWRSGQNKTEEPVWQDEQIQCGEPGLSHWFCPPGGERDGNDWVLALDVRKG